VQPGDASPSNEGALLVAARGHAPWMRALDKKDAPKQFLAPVGRERPESIVVTHSVERGHTSLEALGEVLAQADIDAAMRPVDSQAKYALVARGDAHAYLRIPQEVQRVETVWDHAAGVAIARATGNVATDLRGKPLDFSACPFMVRNRGIVCAHPGLHGELIDAIAALGLG
jgi:3'(2'), 5'-bisphosphate nucleotidase